jgi:peptide/nickel transport system substrate-binding protein
MLTHRREELPDFARRSCRRPGAYSRAVRRGGTLAIVIATVIGLAGGVFAVPASAEKSKAAKAGGDVVWGLDAETPEGWCLPASQLAASGIIVANSIYDTLVTINSKGEYVPYLAQSITPNATYDQWTIKLRPNVKFHDGSALDADVVKLNLDAYRGLNPKINARTNPFVFQNVADVQVVDPLTLSVTTKTPWPAFPALLFGGGRNGIVARAQLDDPATCATNLIGTGPFELQEWRVNDHLTVTRNPDYWRNGYPLLDKITFRPVPDSNVRLTQFQGGQLDVMHTSSSDVIAQLRDYAKGGKATFFETSKGADVAYLMLNASKPPFDDILARKAVQYGRNTAVINQIRNRGIPELATGPFGPGTMGYLKDAGIPDPNLKKARKLVDEYTAKHGAPPNYTYTTVNTPDTIAIAELVKEQAAKFGVTVTIDTVDQATLINRALSGDFQGMGFRNHPGGDPDAQGVWWRTGSPINFGRIKDPEIDRLLDEGRVETDPAKRKAIYEDLTRRFADQAWNSWSWYTVWAIAAKPDVKGLLGPALPDGHGKPFPLYGGTVPVLGESRSD